MNNLTARIISTLRTEVSVERFNRLHAEALQIDNKIEAAMSGPECFDCDEVFKMHEEGRRLNSNLEDLAWKLNAEFESAGVRVVSQWGLSGDWAIFLSPHNVSNSRNAEFLITSPVTLTH